MKEHFNCIGRAKMENFKSSKKVENLKQEISELSDKLGRKEK